MKYLIVLSLFLSSYSFAGSDTIDVPLDILCTPGYTQGYNLFKDGKVVKWFSKDQADEAYQAGAVPVRDVSAKKKRLVYVKAWVPFGDRDMCREGYEVDHRVMLGVGGSNDISNLQLQAYCTFEELVKNEDGTPVFKGLYDSHAKDALEDSLRKDVCSGKIELIDAQNQLRNWRN